MATLFPYFEFRRCPKCGKNIQSADEPINLNKGEIRIAKSMKSQGYSHMLWINSGGVSHPIYFKSQRDADNFARGHRNDIKWSATVDDAVEASTRVITRKRLRGTLIEEETY